MKIKVLNQDDQEITFVMEGEEVTPQLANELRRIMMNEIPVLAIDIVEFSDNGSALYDEILSHRLGLIPLVFDGKALNLPQECKCGGKGCAQCQVVLALSKKGPSMVYAKDFKSSDKSVKPLYEDTPIVELFEDQKLKLEATAVLGLGKNHAKWQASKPYFRYYPIVVQKGKVANPDVVEKICPQKAIKVKDGKVEIGPECDLSCHPERVAEPKGALSVSGDEKRIIFTVETISSLKPEGVVLEGIAILQKKSKEFGKLAAKLE